MSGQPGSLRARAPGSAGTTGGRRHGAGCDDDLAVQSVRNHAGFSLQLIQKSIPPDR
jgi:hypothetical protein